jgi:hypothetical protein
MNMKTKIIAAAALAAIAVPTVAIADGSDRSGEAHKRNAERKAAKSTNKGKAFVVKGVDGSNLTVTDGKLAGPLTLDPTSANKHARTFLELTKTELRGEDTVSFGEANDEVKINYVGLQPTDALQPTDTIKVIGKVTRASEPKLNIRKITVKRESETQS